MNTKIMAQTAESTHRDSFDIIRQRRGWTSKSIWDMSASPHDYLTYLPQAVDLIARHIDNGGDITILTDFDMDGLCAGIITYAGLSEATYNKTSSINLVIPDYHGSRDVEPADIDTAMNLYPNTTLIITCDEGTNSAAGVAHARHHYGIDVLITDHHHQERTTEATVLLNPNAANSTYSQPDICGSQVAYHLVSSYAMNHAHNTLPQISMLKMFAGIGALADVMPLTGQTRSLIREALPLIGLSITDIPNTPWGSWDAGRALNAHPENAPLTAAMGVIAKTEEMKNAFYGFAVLLQQFIVAKKLRTLDDINVSFLGFTLAPTFNATRRVEGDMADAFYIFAPRAVRTMFPDYELDRESAAQTLISNNEYRKHLTKQALTTLDDSQHKAIIYYSDAPSGILGLLATRIANNTGLPTIVLNPNTLSGSARSPQWFPLITATENIDTVRCAGHEHACGVTIESHEAGDELVTALLDLISTVPADDKATPLPDLIWGDITTRAHAHTPWAQQFYDNVDIPVPTVEETQTLVDHLDRIGPFGHGFEYPRIELRACIAECEISSLSGGKHLKITTPSGVECLWWNVPVTEDELEDYGEHLSMEITVDVSEFRGVERTQGIIRRLTIDGKEIH